MRTLKRILVISAIFLLGIILGGYIFSGVEPRSVLTVPECKDTCLRPNEILGLLGSISMQKVPGLIPFVVKESDKNIVIEPPIRRAPIHYVVIPKKDIKDVADISAEDQKYLLDAYALIGELIRENNLDKYKIYTNGPGYQTVNYLHFHLLSGDGQ